jgi:molecular chaperone DnaK (HSP70)
MACSRYSILQLPHTISPDGLADITIDLIGGERPFVKDDFHLTSFNLSRVRMSSKDYMALKIEIVIEFPDVLNISATVIPECVVYRIVGYD